MLPTDRDFMERALARARQARDTGEVPVGAVLVDAGGQILAEAGNAPIANHDPSAHAEMLVLRDAAQKVRNYRLPGTTLYVTLEPCPMCAGALVHARVERIVYAAADPRAGACGTVFDLARSDALNHRIEITSGVLEDEGSALLKSFFAERR
ncbi:MAG: tRNA adenosine(34) deaminase TadA [Gammaproteobacteria bacterium]|nr:tRNA adenosine(34) deaminase TadA [Gammaproteobacteria bacterium]MDH3505552.1 tRNA adenosine(34) deaminase TadA [Gammaproteobacteria bacterium]